MKKLVMFTAVIAAALMLGFTSISESKTALSPEFEKQYKKYLSTKEKISGSYETYDYKILKIQQEILNQMNVCLDNIKTPEDFITLFNNGDGRDISIPSSIGKDQEQFHSPEVLRLTAALIKEAKVYEDKMHMSEYYKSAVRFFNTNVPTLSVVAGTSDFLHTSIQLKKPAYKYTPTELYWVLYFSEEVIVYDQLNLSKEDKEKAIKNIEASPLPLSFFYDLEKD